MPFSDSHSWPYYTNMRVQGGVFRTLTYSSTYWDAAHKQFNSLCVEHFDQALWNKLSPVYRSSTPTSGYVYRSQSVSSFFGALKSLSAGN
jgi:hypothetical protein